MNNANPKFELAGVLVCGICLETSRPETAERYRMVSKASGVRRKVTRKATLIGVPMPRDDRKETSK